MQSPAPACATQAVSLLKNCGVEIIFGIPGVHTVELYRGIAMAKMRHITPRHEQAAAFMADGYARATGKIGVCCLITGPGLTNAATALAQSYSDSIPVLALSSVNTTASLGRGLGKLHELPNQRLLASQFCAFSSTITDAESVPDVFARAFAVFGAARPQPVHIEFPLDLMNQPVRWRPDPIRMAQSPKAAAHLIDQAKRLLLDSDQNAFIFGGGCKHASAEATELVDYFNAPAVTTFAGKGVIASAHPLSLGANLLHPPVLDYLKQAQTVLAVGTHLSETDIWCRDGRIEFDGRLIRIDIDSNQIHKNAPAELGLIGDSRLILRDLLQSLSSADFQKRPDRREQAGAVRQLIEKTHAHWYADTGQCAEVWNIIRNALPDDGIVTADSTKLVYSGNFCYPCDQPRTYLTSTTGYGTLGYALPAAIGAQFGKPQSPVVCVAGDGGLMFTIQELATAAEHRLPIVIVLWNNGGYGIIRDTLQESGVAHAGFDVPPPDFLTVARGFGCHAAHIERLDELQSQLEAGFERDKPTLLEIKPEDWV